MSEIPRLLRIKMAVAGVLGHMCSHCGRIGRWPWEKPYQRVQAQDAPGPGPWATATYVPILETNHKNGRKYSIRRLHRHTKWLRYLDEALSPKGLVEASCGLCNRKHGTRIRYPGPVDKTRQGQPRAKRKKPC